jgi:ABC-type Mn2+/Zn2+ transport system permease subunit
MTKTIRSMMAVAGLIGVVTVWFGLTLSYYLGTAASATMALVPIVAFFLVLATKSLLKTVKVGVEA